MAKRRKQEKLYQVVSSLVYFDESSQSKRLKQAISKKADRGTIHFVLLAQKMLYPTFNHVIKEVERW